VSGTGQDPNAMPWGAMDRFQAHYVVRREDGPGSHALAARTVVETEGRCGARRVARVSWSGAGPLADALNADGELNAMIAAMGRRGASIMVEPTGAGVRIHGPWRAAHEFGVTAEEFGVYDRIAGHVRAA